MSSTIASDHPTLVGLAEQVVAHLIAAPEKVTAQDDSLFLPHREYAERAASLGRYLESALKLAASHAYAEAFCLERAALERLVSDQLYMLAQKYTVQYVHVARDEWDRWEDARHRGDAGTDHVIHAAYKDGNPQVTYSGFHSQVPGGPTLSVYYFLEKDYDPFQGSASEQKLLIPEFVRHRDHVRRAKTVQNLYGHYLGWDDLLANLELNGLITARNAFRLGVHYRFLSAFVHPFKNLDNMVYGKDHWAVRYDHYSSELVLLYILAFGVRELRTLFKGLARQPRGSLRGIGEYRDLVRDTDRASRHLWFPGQPAHEYDRVQEANNRRLSEGRRFVPIEKRTSPQLIRSGEIRYYRNPLKRLVRLHCTANELTGWPYVSPWPRPDAWLH